ncbi:MAG: flagellar hook-length control protein FliK [Lachnospiraceae bacterium]
MAIDLLNMPLKQIMTKLDFLEDQDKAVFLSDRLKSLLPGDIIQGQITKLDGIDVKLLLFNAMNIQAKLDSSISLKEGAMIQFQVKSNSEKGLIIQPLFENIAQEETVVKSLQMANLPITNDSIEMVKSLMDKNMPIQKQVLTQIFKEINANTQLTPKEIVTLHFLDIPINEEAIQQMISYKENTHLVKDSISYLKEAVEPFIEELLRDCLSTKESKVIEHFLDVLKENIPLKSDELSLEYTKIKNDLLQVLSNKGIEEVTIQGAVCEKFQENMQQTSLQQPQELLQEITNQTTILESTDVKKAMITLFHKIFMNNGLMDEVDVGNKEKIQEFYETLNQTISSLKSGLEKMDKIETGFSKAVFTMNSNLDFINHINQVYQYVQLPVKLEHNEANAELFLFTNKKNLAQEDGKISAFLHLDMNALGPVDVFISLDKQSVVTNFKLSNEKSLELIEKNISMLNERVQKKGYDITIHTQLIEQDTSEEFSISKLINESKFNSCMACKGFDARV